MTINDELLAELHEKAAANERLRMNFDLRTTPEDTSQRMLNVLEPELMQDRFIRSIKTTLEDITSGVVSF